MHLVTRMIFVVAAAIILFADYLQQLHHKTKQCRVRERKLSIPAGLVVGRVDCFKI